MTVQDRKRASGQMAHHGGAAAEDRVAQVYEDRGMRVAGRRWRGAGGEIDLILRDGAGLIFVEVKKSRTFDGAADRLNTRQMRRLCASAEEFVAGEPAGLLTEMRFDVALVDATGQCRIVENAFGGA